MKEEIWKDIEGFEGLYQVSSFGKVKSLPKKFKVYNQCGETNGYRVTKETILKPQQDKYGYLRVTLCDGKKHHLKQIHRLVAETFIPNVDNLPEVNHKDENKCNNFVKNLEHCTSQYNQTYGTIRKRISEAQSIDVLQIDFNGAIIKKWHGINNASRVLKINHANIISCCKGKRKSAGGYIWRYVDE